MMQQLYMNIVSELVDVTVCRLLEAAHVEVSICWPGP